MGKAALAAPALTGIGGVSRGRKQQIESALGAEGVHGRIVVPCEARQRQKSLAPAYTYTHPMY